MKKYTIVAIGILIFIIVVLTAVAQISDTRDKKVYEEKTETFCDEKTCTTENVSILKRDPLANYDYKEPRYERIHTKSNTIGMAKSKEIQCQDFWEFTNNTKANSTGYEKQFDCKTVLVYTYKSVNESSILP